MSEPVKKTPAPLPSVSGGKTPAQNSAQVQAAVPPAKVVPPSAPVAAAPASSPALFGGHKGGGKKRRDGLIAGSPAAIAADKASNAERMRLARAERRAAETPPALPPRVASAESPAGAVPVGELPLRVPVDFSQAAPAPLAGGNFPTFVAWSQKLLEKPAKLLVKISERFLGLARSKQVRKLNLAPEREKKILEALKWGDEVKADFAQSLAECTTIELNRRMVPGAQHSHWITLAMSLGELAHHEMNNSALIEKLVLEDRAEKAKAEKV